MNILDIKRNNKRQKSLTYQGEIDCITDNLLKHNFATSWQNEKWVTNLSEFKGIEGRLYLLIIKDLFNHEIIVNDLLISPNFEQIIWMI